MQSGIDLQRMDRIDADQRRAAFPDGAADGAFQLFLIRLHLIVKKDGPFFRIRDAGGLHGSEKALPAACDLVLLVVDSFQRDKADVAVTVAQQMADGGGNSGRTVRIHGPDVIQMIRFSIDSHHGNLKQSPQLAVRGLVEVENPPE